jgi:N-acetyl sugar amidotransferase
VAATEQAPGTTWDDGSRRVCTRCVMSDTDPDITFDAEGRCNHCTGYLDHLANLTYKPGTSDRELESIVERIKAAGRKKDYDCVVGVSGGVDSCYAAYIVTTLGLRPLVLHLDNGWNSDIAVKNIKNLAQKLGIDYQSYVLDWEEFRDLQLAFLRASVPEIETPTDIAIPAALHRVAAEHGVRYIIAGGNYATEGILPRAWHYNAKDVRFLKAVHRRFGSGKLGSFPTFGFVKEIYYKFAKGVRIVYLLNLVPYSKSDAMRKLQEDFGWEYYGGKHYESKITSFVQSYILPVKFNIDYRRATLSSEICAGAVTRDEALEILKTPPFDAARVPEDKAYVAKKFGITIEEMDAILAEPRKTHRDYPNSERFLEFIYAVYRRYAGAKMAVRAQPTE